MKNEIKENKNLIKESWDDKDLGDFIYHYKEEKKWSFSVKFFIFSSFIFLISIFFTAYNFYSKDNVISSQNIDFVLRSESLFSGGTEESLNIFTTNRNSLPILNAYAVISYDSGENVSGSNNLINQKVEFGDILPNASINKDIKVEFFGNQGDKKTISATLFYKLPNTKAEFHINAENKEIVLKDSPVLMKIDSFKEMIQGNSYEYSLTIKNNTNKEIKNLIVSARTPKDFVYESSSEELFNQNPSWIIKNLKPLEEKKIKFKGKLYSPLYETSVFTFFAGVSSVASSTKKEILDDYNLNLNNIYSKIEKSILVTGQYLEVSVVSDSSEGKSDVASGDSISLEFNIKNNLNFPVDNVFLKAEISGDNGIDKENTYGFDAVFDKENNIIIWDQKSLSSLSQISAKGEVKVRLNLRVSRNAKSDDKIIIKLFAEGERNAEDSVSNEQNVSLERIWTVEQN